MHLYVVLVEDALLVGHLFVIHTFFNVIKQKKCRAMTDVYRRLEASLHVDTADAVLCVIDAYVAAARPPISSHEVAGLAGERCKFVWTRNVHSDVIRRFALSIPGRHFQRLMEKYNFEYQSICCAIMRDEFV